MIPATGRGTLLLAIQRFNQAASLAIDSILKQRHARSDTDRPVVREIVVRFGFGRPDLVWAAQLGHAEGR